MTSFLSARVRAQQFDPGILELFTAASEYVGLEYDGPRQRAVSKADVFYDCVTFPFPSQSFDSVFASEVLEHVFAPEKFFKEIHRVLRPGGMLLLSAPFVWDEHEQPHDYARYSSFGIRYLLEKNGFTVIEQRKTGNAVLAIFQLTACYINRNLKIKNYKIKLVFQIVFVAPITSLGIIIS